MSLEAMCALAQVSRRGYYRFLGRPEGGDADIELRDTVQRIALEFPSYGRPRMTLNCTGGAGGWGRTGSTASCEKTICCVSAAGDS
jgi:hypothetical protein